MKRGFQQKKSLEELQIGFYIEFQGLMTYANQSIQKANDKVLKHLKDQRGIGTLELIFITVIVLGMAVLFRNQITDIFKKVYEALQKLNQNMNMDPLSQQST